MGKGVFDYSKPVSLIDLFIQLSTRKDDIVLDFFSGSGTTAQAVIEKNLEDFGSRKFILVQLPIVCDPSSEAAKLGYKTICDIGKERIRKTWKKIQEDKNQKWKLDEKIGFKVYKLVESNFRKYSPVMGKNKDALSDFITSLDSMVDTLKDGYKTENVLEEIKLRQGFALDCSVEEVKEVSSNKVWHLTDPERPITLYVCLDKKIDQRTVDSLNIGKDDKFICLNSAIDDTTYARLADKNRVQTL